MNRAKQIMLALYFLVPVYMGLSWVINLIQFFKLDFNEPYKDEIIKLIGVVVPPLNSVTVWF